MTIYRGYEVGEDEATEGKKDGHGIGLSQVRDTLEHNHGKMTIESEVGVGLLTRCRNCCGSLHAAGEA